MRTNKADRTHQQMASSALTGLHRSFALLERTDKSGGSTPFYHMKKGAATTRQNALSIVVSVERVVAVAAVLQNSVVEKEQT